MKSLAEALDSLSRRAIGFLARHPGQKDIEDYGKGFSAMILNIGSLAAARPLRDKFSNPCCSNHYAGGRYCVSSVAVKPLMHCPQFPRYSSLTEIGDITSLPAAPVVEIRSKHFLDKSEAYCSAKIRILPEEKSLSARFRKWDEAHHGGAMPGKPFFWLLKEPKEVFEALAHDFVFGRHPEYAAAFFEEFAYLPLLLTGLVDASEPSHDAISKVLAHVTYLEDKLR